MQVKRDIRTKQSKGFGFIRFAEYESQLKALSQQHLLEGRWCDIRIPNSQVLSLLIHVKFRPVSQFTKLLISIFHIVHILQ